MQTGIAHIVLAVPNSAPMPSLAEVPAKFTCRGRFRKRTISAREITILAREITIFAGEITILAREITILAREITILAREKTISQER